MSDNNKHPKNEDDEALVPMESHVSMDRLPEKNTLEPLKQVLVSRPGVFIRKVPGMPWAEFEKACLRLFYEAGIIAPEDRLPLGDLTSQLKKYSEKPE
jgi:hypothetical protein